MAQPFEHISRKWLDTIKSNEQRYNKAIEQVQQQELDLIASLGDIEKLEAQSRQVNEAQMTNMRELQQINDHQAAMLDDLNGIEDELDKFLKGQGMGDRYMSKLFDQPQRDTPSTREEVF